MSMITAFIPTGFLAAFTAEELTAFEQPMSEETLAGFWAAYKAKAIAATKATGMELKSLKAEEIKFPGEQSIFVLYAGQVEAAYTKDGNYPWEPADVLLAAGMLYRTFDALNAASYAAEKEDFSLYSAARKAKDEGKRFVIAENLS